MSINQLGLADKVVLVTGGNTGIGLATVKLFLKLGATCVVNYISGAGLSDFSSEEIDRCVGIKADISDAEQVREMFLEIEDKFGRLDVLINNASVRPFSDIQGISESDWDEVSDTNLKGTFFCSQAAAKLMKGRGGKIVNVSSALALKGSTDGAHYCASKGGMLGLTNSFARELAPGGILVNAILPGVALTQQPNMTPEEFAEKAKSIPLGRIAEPIDIANAILFFASELNDYVTGQSLVVNGGQPV